MGWAEHHAEKTPREGQGRSVDKRRYGRKGEAGEGELHAGGYTHGEGYQEDGEAGVGAQGLGQLGA